MNLAGDLLPVNQSLEAPAGPLSDLEILVGLAQQLDVALPAVEEVDAAVIAAASKDLDVSFGDKRFGSPLRQTQGDIEQKRRTIWDGGGTSAHDERVAPIRQAGGNGVATIDLVNA